jgi:hypothetical protein
LLRQYDSLDAERAPARFSFATLFSNIDPEVPLTGSFKWCYVPEVTFLAGVAKLAYAADSKTSANGDSTTSKTYRNLPKISFKPTTGADFSPMFRQKMGDSYRKSIGDI